MEEGNFKVPIFFFVCVTLTSECVTLEVVRKATLLDTAFLRKIIWTLINILLL